MDWGNVIAAIPGVAGVVVASLAFKRATEAKSIGLRVEFGREIESARQELNSLGELIARADSKRRSMFAASEAHDSGAMQVWYRKVEADRESHGDLVAAIAATEKTPLNSSPNKLTAAIRGLCGIRATIDGLRDKYDRSIVESERILDEFNKSCGR